MIFDTRLVQNSHLRVQRAINAVRGGAMLIVRDDGDRENEGDLILAATHCTAENMAFIVNHTSGIVCAPMRAERARRLNLPLMVTDNTAPFATAFTVTVDLKEGLTTGISAQERTMTIRALADDTTGPGDLVRPGHIFPLVARDGGVLERPGHTEAAVDLCAAAGLPEVGVICELVQPDGGVMSGAVLAEFAAEHGLQMLDIADLIAFRRGAAA